MVDYFFPLILKIIKISNALCSPSVRPLVEVIQAKLSWSCDEQLSYNFWYLSAFNDFTLPAQLLSKLVQYWGKV